MKTIFFGASAYVIPTIAYLKGTTDLQLVVTTESRPTNAVITYCTTNNIPFVSVTKLTEDILEQIRKIQAPIAILADFRLLIKQEVIDLFPKGIVNIHPSLLPEYRGPTPGTTALMDGKTKTGVSLMLLDKEMDHGPILAQEKESVLPNDTSVSLYQRLFAKGAQMLEQTLPDYVEGKITPQEQDHSKAIYTKFLTRESGFVPQNELEKMENKKRDNMIRAYFPWPGVWTLLRLSGKEKVVKLLPNNMLQVEGKKPVAPKDFLNGYPETKEFLEKLGLI